MIGGNICNMVLSGSWTETLRFPVQSTTLCNKKLGFKTSENAKRNLDPVVNERRKMSGDKG